MTRKVVIEFGIFRCENGVVKIDPHRSYENLKVVDTAIKAGLLRWLPDAPMRGHIGWMTLTDKAFDYNIKVIHGDLYDPGVIIIG